MREDFHVMKKNSTQHQLFHFFRQIGIRLSLDHHSQGLLFIVTIFLIIFRVWWSLPGMVLYGVMHFQYEGIGTFQKPARIRNQTPDIADVVYVAAGIFGIVIMFIGIVIRIGELSGIT